jgi:hypothetical protein
MSTPLMILTLVVMSPFALIGMVGTTVEIFKLLKLKGKAQ